MSIAGCCDAASLPTPIPRYPEYKDSGVAWLSKVP